MFGQSTRVVEHFAADGTPNDGPHHMTVHGRLLEARSGSVASVSWQSCGMIPCTSTTQRASRFKRLGGPGVVAEAAVINGHLTCNNNKG